MTEAELIASIKANLAAAEAENAKAQEYLLSAFTRTIDLARSPDDRGDARQGGSTLSRGCRSACAELVAPKRKPWRHSPRRGP